MMTDDRHIMMDEFWAKVQNPAAKFYVVLACIVAHKQKRTLWCMGGHNIHNMTTQGWWVTEDIFEIHSDRFKMRVPNDCEYVIGTAWGVPTQ